MKQYITRVGLSTTYIENIEKFSDILIEKNIYYSNKKNNSRKAIESVLEEVDGRNLTLITVGVNINNEKNAPSLLKALGMVSSDTVILCVQKGEDGIEDAAALVVSSKINEDNDILAEIIEINSKTTSKKSRLHELYKKSGPVFDAISVIESCIAVKYGFDFSKDWSGEMFFNENLDNDQVQNSIVSDGSILLREVRQNFGKRLKTNKYIIPLSFEEVNDLNEGLEFLKKRVLIDDISNVAYEYLDNYINSSEKNKTVVFVGVDKNTVINEIELFKSEENNWFIPFFKWETKMGSCYASTPIGKKAKICYINPPGGMFSKLAFYRLYRALPQLKDKVEKNRIEKKSEDPLIARYYFEIMTIMLTVRALETIGIRQDAIIGGSLGELSIPLIFDVTVANGELIKAEESSLDIMYEIIRMLEDLISSQMDLSRRYFKKNIKKIEKWYLVCDYKKVKLEMSRMEKNSPIFITIIGSPRDLIISGTHELCEQIISKLNCYAIQFRDPIYAHTPILEPMRKMITNSIVNKQLHLADNIGFDIYSTSKLTIIDNSIDMFAENFADCLIRQVNMPNILQKTYEDGCKVYIDLGSSMFCSRWAKETFKSNRDVLVLPLFDKKSSEESIISTLAITMTNHLNINYSKQFDLFFRKGNKNKKNVEVNKMEQKKTQVITNEKYCSDKGFMQNLILRQFDINKNIFSNYISLEEKIADYISASNIVCKERDTVVKCLYNYRDILEMTNGSMAKVLGPVYEDVDKYNIRARMPSPPYLFVSRILDINAKFGEFVSGSSIEAEYDIPNNCILKVSQKTVSSVVFSEAAHIGIFLAGYMGIDAYSSGRSKFRITDVSTKYVSEKWPEIGDTIRMKFVIERVVKNGDMTLLFCDFKVYLGEEMIVDAKETGGFFTQEALNIGAGINQSNEKTCKNILKECKNNFYNPVTTKKSFTKNDIYDFLCGNYRKCFGVEAANSSMPYQVYEDSMFINKIIEISATGGKYNLGYAVAEMKINEDFWPFKSHFKNDPVLPGTIMLEGLNQTVTFFQTYMGLYNTINPFVTKMKTGYVIKTKFRGEVKKTSHVLQYRIDTKVVKKVDNGLLFVADGKVYCDGLQVIEQKDAAMIIGE